MLNIEDPVFSTSTERWSTHEKHLLNVYMDAMTTTRRFDQQLKSDGLQENNPIPFN